MIEGLTRNAARNIFFGGSLVFFLTFVGLTAHSHYYIVTTSTDHEGITESVRQGKHIWEENSCINCHSLLGEGAYFAPELGNVWQRYNGVENPEQAAGGQGSENVYMSWRNQARDLAVATLVDVSLSTDAWIGDRRVLDVEKEALLVLAHAIQACGDEHAIYTFTSRRRQRIDIRRIKSFNQQVCSATERRITALEPGQYTRMGAAIRHVAAQLAEQPNRHRLLLMLTDGKPNDTDHYEGRFAMDDTAMAVREARRNGLTVFGVTIDAEARQNFPAIFGRAGYAIVARPESLAAALPLLYRQLIS